MYISPDGWSQYTERWSVKTLCNMMDRGQLDFDWDKQRGYVWNKSKASLFIHSIFWGMLENTETFRFTKHDKKFLCTDGKQRGLSILKYINNEYALTGLKDGYEIYLSDGTTFPVNGKRFKQLPQELQDKIYDLQINIAILDNASADVEAEMFARMNNGQAVSKTDIAVCRNDNSTIFDELGKHELFTIMLGTKGIEAKKYRSVIVKTWVALTESTPNYKSAYLHKLESTLSLSDNDMDDLKSLYDNLVEIYKNVILQEDNIGKKMFDNAFMYYYIPCLDMFSGDFVQASKWMNIFYKNVPVEYSQITGFASDDINTKNKISIIMQSIREFFKTHSDDNQSNEQLTL